MDEPKYKSEVYDSQSEVYPKITIEYWNTSKMNVVNRLKDGKACRIMLAWPELMTMFEVVLVPLDNEYDSLRMVGTGKRDYSSPLQNDYIYFSWKNGGYPLTLDGFHHTGYIMDKLNMGEPEAAGVSLFLKDLAKDLI